MADSRVYKGDIGTKIRLDAGTSISTATTLQIKYKKPSGTTGTWTATLEGTDYAYYYTNSGDIDEDGDWELQLYVVMSTWQGHGVIATMHVYKRITD